MDCFLYDNSLRRERVKPAFSSTTAHPRTFSSTDAHANPATIDLSAPAKGQYINFNHVNHMLTVKKICAEFSTVLLQHY